MADGVKVETSPARLEASRTAAAVSVVPLVAVAGVFLLVYAPTLAWLYERWTLSVWHNAHGMLIPPVVAYFCWIELKAARDLPVSVSPLGFLFLIPALLLHVVDTGIHTQLLSAISIVVAMPGLALLLLGLERTKRMAFPLALLAFMLPLPLALTEQLHLVLRKIAAVLTAEALPPLGLPVLRDGFTLVLPNARLFVADACSGFSTLYASVAVAFLVAYTTASWRRRLVVLVLAVPIAIAANWVRMVLLSFLVYWYGIGVLETWMHTGTGMLTFVLALPAIFALGGRPEPAGGRP